MLPPRLDTYSAVLTVVRRAHELANLADDPNTKLLLRAGIMPKSFLRSAYGHYPGVFVQHLVEDGKLERSGRYLRANPRIRLRPTVSKYCYDKPRVSPHHRASMTITLFGRDRLALWYSAANEQLDGSKGESTGLFHILEFWRLPNVQRIWRRYIDNPKFRLPDDAQPPSKNKRRR